MSRIILHKEGIYNIYSTEADAPIFKKGISLKQLKAFIQDQCGKKGLEKLPKRLERCHSKGTSRIGSENLSETILRNRAGENDEFLPETEFIEKYLS